ncbi:Protein ltv1 [Malassezia yamatoensis]|uniref:Protein ltv1 n=1 Tax=Malassezia yamatoensis TaxID=253288 RepID=A0AAJ5YRY5_9BASI|nr:Protein ltv1 [Malassezia yamatoensis]
MPPKSKWRQPEAVHFQVVHRSLRDSEPEAGPHVLKPYQPANRQKGKSRAELVQEDPSLESQTNAARPNAGEAALYGVYYDDTEYDYMQHLRAMNDGENSRRGGADEEDDTDAIWVPSAVQPKERSNAKSFALKDDQQSIDSKPSLMLPASAFASKELPLTYNTENVDPELQGLQPDMDPHLRQTLEALDDNEFVEDEIDDDFFGGLIQGGQWDRQADEVPSWRDEAPEGDAIYLDPLQRALREKQEADSQGKELSLEARVALFKHQQLQPEPSLGHGPSSELQGSDTDTAEARDELGDLPNQTALPRATRRAGSVSSTGSALGKSRHPGALARRAASTKAGSVGGGSTVWSMSSSAMFRNQGLTDLDDRFDRTLRSYGVELDDESAAAWEDMPDDEDQVEVDYDNVDQLTRDDFEEIMDEFLEKHEVVAGKLRESLGGRDATADEKLSMIRKGLGDIRLTEDDDDADLASSNNPFLNPEIIGADREKWDVETIQTTKTNLENHPRTITAEESVAPSTRHVPSLIGTGVGNKAGFNNARIPQVQIHPRTGAPRLVGFPKASRDKESRGSQSNLASHAENQVMDKKDVSENLSHSTSNHDLSSSRMSSKAAIPHSRDRNESKEQRRARKEAVKLEKQSRRAEKSATKQSFTEERKRQLNAARRQHEATGGQTAAHLT